MHISDVPESWNQIGDGMDYQMRYQTTLVALLTWRVNPSVFKMFDALWGPHTVDRFASDSNAQIVRYNSRFWSLGSEAAGHRYVYC